MASTSGPTNPPGPARAATAGELAPRLTLAGAGQANLAHLLLARSLIQRGGFEQALEQLNAALAENPELAAGHFLKGLIYLRRAEFPAARDELRLAVRLDATEVDPWLTLAFVHWELEEFEQGLAAVEGALRADPQQGQAYWLRGGLLSSQGQSAEAIAAYRQAVQINPRLSIAWLKLAPLLLKTGATEEAIQHVILAQRLEPTNPNSRMALGDLLRHLGRHQEAIKEYKAAADLRPLHGAPQSKLGETYREMGLTTDAIAAFQVSVRLDPKNVSGFMNLGEIFMEQHSYDAAVAMFQAAADVDPRFPEAKAWLEQAQHLAGRGGV